MDAEAVIWTEGKTDWQHLKRAYQALQISSRLAFKELSDDMGDDQLLKQCQALSRDKQIRPTIFIFDCDKNDIVAKVEDSGKGYKAWGNNVYSFAIPVPSHRSGRGGACIELYYTDTELTTPDKAGRRLFLSSEFNPASGRHISDSRLSVGQKGKLQGLAKGAPVSIIDSEVFDEQHRNVALSKAEFAKNVLEKKDSFTDFNFEAFRAIFSRAETLLEQTRERLDLAFGALSVFLRQLDKLDTPHQLAATLEGAIRASKLIAMAFIGITIRYYDPAVSPGDTIEEKRLRPIRRALVDNFTSPSLATLLKVARSCYHLVSDPAPEAVQLLKAVMGQSPTLGPIGTLLDDLERAFPPDPHRVRIAKKSQLRKPILDFVLPELAKYEGRLADITGSTVSASFEPAHVSAWKEALAALIQIFAPLESLPFRVGLIERSRNDKFDVLLTTYRNGRAISETVSRDYQDVTADRFETDELLLEAGHQRESLDISPFLTIRNANLYYYSRTRAVGYEYSTPFDALLSNGGLSFAGHVLLHTKRKFSHMALGAIVAADRQLLFWAPVAPSTSATGVKANIPAQDPGTFVGRKQQLTTIMEEIIQIPNQNGILWGPGGVGKTALLIELSRLLFEEESPPPFKNIIWASAKRDYYDPTIDEVEKGSQQFRSLDNIFTTILDFHGWEDAEVYDFTDKKWLVSEVLREDKTLIVLDNFESVPEAAQKEIVRFFGVEVKRFLKDKPDYLKVLLTSRELTPSGFHQIGLRGLDKRDSKRLMQLLDEPYKRSVHTLLTDEQRDELYEATRGIPLIIKHCYGQLYEYNQPLDHVLRNLSEAGNKVVDFSFAEIFSLVQKDEVQLRILLLLWLIGHPVLLRQISDILAVGENDIAQRVAALLNFQCLTRSNAGTDDKYAINDEVRLFTARIARQHMQLATEIRRQIAGLSLEKRMDYTQEEFDALVIFQDHLAKGQVVQAEDFIKDQLKRYKDSVLLSLHYAKYLKEVQRKTTDAIDRLEGIRTRSGNDPQVLRLLMAYYASLEPPNFEQAHRFARELESIGSDESEMNLEIARFYTEWSTAVKMTFELDPLKERLREQKYKELADAALALLKRIPEKLAVKTPEYYYLLAQNHYNKWRNEAALRYVDRGIDLLPRSSYLARRYKGLRSEIVKKQMLQDRRERA